MRNSSQSLDQLAKVAAQQGGYFTARQARRAGFKEGAQPYHVRVGNWIRICRGVYRFSWFPTTSESCLFGWLLWSAGRSGNVEATLSHQTALFIHGLIDELGEPYHLIVPTTFRRNSETPDAICLHKAAIQDAETECKNGMRVTAILRSLQDVIRSKSMTPTQIERILSTMVDDGRLTPGQLRDLMEKQMPLFGR